MTGPHPELGSELRQLAQDILDRLDPAVRLAAANFAASADGNPGKCQQVWCPVCALAAVVNGEQHPLLSVIAEHSVALLTVIRAVLDDGRDDGTGPDGPDNGPGGGSPPPGGGPDTPPPDDYPSPPPPGRYQHIPVTIEDRAD
ncbi:MULTISPECIES: hypothetical protein [Mycolicibacterium]|uniref:Uncharacterized protein n=1 Tax=Mycolicibacterium senegalense TaxID=1796 RepID=A0A378T2D1_9MYCO|nr:MULTISPECIES: hypothetical protein [Mycolicibacterium]MCV7335433.1 hypothetical protein [Mycolicibacterium senegalense]MDR7290612.1 hypothetical protein [Mycolicibacterium senegalense]QZA22187.1 hypothetical protein K3U95_15525 [Mycolicibacterium senegalense]CDP89317.1 hypothetical protein BN975_05169 [Mycolicibacterium farcinogenes]STZ54035.1 Uncharacterised protein [Mycolicibacterium senegalense]